MELLDFLNEAKARFNEKPEMVTYRNKGGDFIALRYPDGQVEVFVLGERLIHSQFYVEAPLFSGKVWKIKSDKDE